MILTQISYLRYWYLRIPCYLWISSWIAMTQNAYGSQTLRSPFYYQYDHILNQGRETMTTFNIILINFHTRLAINLTTLSSNWLSGISFGILINSTLFLLLYFSDLAWFFSKSITLFSSLLLTTLTIASSLLICRFAAATVA